MNVATQITKVNTTAARYNVAFAAFLNIPFENTAERAIARKKMIAAREEMTAADAALMSHFYKVVNTVADRKNLIGELAYGSESITARVHAEARGLIALADGDIDKALEAAIAL